jgi:hypothetical protein
MGSLRELHKRGQLHNAYFVVERLFHESSCVEAWSIISAGNNSSLAAFTQSIIARKRSLSRRRRGGDRRGNRGDARRGDRSGDRASNGS